MALAACTATPSATGTPPSATGTPEPTASAPGSGPSEQAVASDAPASLEPFDHGDIPSELVGRYSMLVVDHYEQDRYVDLNADGTFSYLDGPLAYGQPVGGVLVTGQFGVFGNEIVFGSEVADIGLACLGDGRYTWVLEGEQLTMVVVDDSCTVGRVDDWQVGWTKMDAS
jgi:hypothetical protein